VLLLAATLGACGGDDNGEAPQTTRATGGAGGAGGSLPSACGPGEVEHPDGGCCPAGS
jgi:hypothetical protein